MMPGRKHSSVPTKTIAPEIRLVTMTGPSLSVLNSSVNSNEPALGDAERAADDAGADHLVDDEEQEARRPRRRAARRGSRCRRCTSRREPVAGALGARTRGPRG